MISPDDQDVSVAQRPATRTEFDPASFAASRLPISFLPTPTAEYRTRRKLRRATVTSGLPSPIPIPVVPAGPRVLLYKQDPAVAEIGIRKAWLPARVLPGPKDSRIEIRDVAPVSPNALGDFVQTPGTESFDAVHTFAVVRQTLTLFQRALHPRAIPWQWNGATNTSPIGVHPRAGQTANAYYSRTERALKFFWFDAPNAPPGAAPVFTCRSLDIVAHETGHAVLDGLKPGWLAFANPPQTGGLHESFGDLTAIFLALSQLDQVEAAIAQTRANLHDKTFLSDLAEQFGLALGRPNGLRNADNDFKLSQVGNEVHAISQVMTGGIYDFLADVFSMEWNRTREDPAQALLESGRYVFGLYLRAIVASPTLAATFADVVNRMISLSASDGKPDWVRTSLRNRFSFREVISSTPLAGVKGVAGFAAEVTDPPHAVQNRSSCCGTMQLCEYCETDDEEIRSLHEHFSQVRSDGPTRKKSEWKKSESRLAGKI